MYINIRSGDIKASLKVELEEGFRVFRVILEDYIPHVNLDEYELSSKRKFETLNSSFDIYSMLLSLHNSNLSMGSTAKGTSYDNNGVRTNLINLGECLDASKLIVNLLANNINEVTVFASLHNIATRLVNIATDKLHGLKVTSKDIQTYRLSYESRVATEFSNIQFTNISDASFRNQICQEVGLVLKRLLNLFATSTKELGVYDSEVADVVTNGINTLKVLV